MENKARLIPDERRSTKSLFRTFCYGWFRYPNYLYVGQTTKGLQRIYLHDVLNKVEPFQETDEIHFWYCNPRDIEGLETFLIKSLKPFYQTTEGRKAMEKNRLSRPFRLSAKELFEQFSQ